MVSRINQILSETCMITKILGANQTINVSKILEFYGINNYRVALEWAEEEDLLYNVSISPPAITTVLVGNTGAELTLLYNTPYSVTIAAVTQCGLNIATTTLNQLSQSEFSDQPCHIYRYNIIAIAIDCDQFANDSSVCIPISS